jgi:hypothetical protein
MHAYLFAFYVNYYNYSLISFKASEVDPFSLYNFIVCIVAVFVGDLQQYLI